MVDNVIEAGMRELKRYQVLLRAKEIQGLGGYRVGGRGSVLYMGRRCGECGNDSE